VDRLNAYDIAYLVGFVVGGAAYAVLRWAVTKAARDLDDIAGPPAGSTEPRSAVVDDAASRV